MEEIKVGEYIRIKDGYICKATEWWVKEYNKEPETYTEIEKHSLNIIDIVEIGDYVNGYKVLDVMENMNTGEIHLEMPMNYTNKELGDCTIYNKDIKSIVTKERFKNAEVYIDN